MGVPTRDRAVATARPVRAVRRPRDDAGRAAQIAAVAHVAEVVPSPDHDADAAEARTRDRVARTLLLERNVTASAISHELGLTPAAVRRHLDALVSTGLASPIDTAPTGQRGRPARSYRLTEAGRERFPQAYQALAAEAMQFLVDHVGAEAVTEFARARAGAIAGRLSEVAAADPSRPVDNRAGADADPNHLVDLLARALDVDGYATSVRPVGTGAQLCQHHCPVAHVAAAFPQLCEAETELFSQVLGRHVQRLATIANGDGVCTTYIPGPVPAEGLSR
ncbi:MAG TPA: ArsR family transcriptional regulator [Actinopolymorphaceae bacterium]